MQAGTGQCINLLQQNPSAHMHYASMAAWSSLLITRKHHRMLLSYHVSYALLGCGSAPENIQTRNSLSTTKKALFGFWAFKFVFRTRFFPYIESAFFSQIRKALFGAKEASSLVQKRFFFFRLKKKVKKVKPAFQTPGKRN